MIESTSRYADAVTSETERAQVKAFVREAIRFLHAHGKEVAFKEFCKEESQFHQGTLYVFALDYKGTMLAHINPEFVDKNLLHAADKHIQNAIKVLIDTAREGGGWVSYYWPNPETDVISPKISYVVPIGKEFFVGAGYYTQ